MNAVLRPAVPVVNMQIRAANGRDLHLDQHIGSPEGGNLHLANLRTRRSLRFYHRQHCFSHECTYKFAVKIETKHKTYDSTPRATCPVRLLLFCSATILLTI